MQAHHTGASAPLTARLRPLAAALLACLAGHAAAQDTPLPTVQVQGSQRAVTGAQPAATNERVTAADLELTTNVVTAEDTLKYLPSLMVRKRFIGDTQAPLATRTTGVNGSARSLIFADGVLLSALVNNNNGNGSPRWFMVSAEEIAAVNVLYGPYAAAYAGNSYGAVVNFETRMPTKFEATVKGNLAQQHFSSDGTDDQDRSRQLNLTLGDRHGPFAWFFAANHLDSHSQPITFGTLSQSSKPAVAGDAQVSGAYPDRNRTGTPQQVIGAGNLTHTRQDSGKLKLAYDFTPTLIGTYTLGYWQNNAVANAQSYLTDSSGAAYYGAASGNVNLGGQSYSASTVAGQFSSNRTEQRHWMQSATLRTSTGGEWDGELVASRYHYSKDLTRTSTGLYPAAEYAGAGRIADASGTGWSTLDLKATWRPRLLPGQVFTGGLHDDQFTLASPTYNTGDWINGAEGTLYTDARGKTQTKAVWLQDEWKVTPDWTATLGGRYERWQAYNGYNYALASTGAGFPVNQPSQARNGFSPKASLRWAFSDEWQLTASLGKALRFPTVGELYQNVQTGTTYTQANPNLKPENVQSGELSLEHANADGRVRVSLFDEHVRDALIAQTSTVAGYVTPVSYTQNVGRTRQRGVELVASRRDVLLPGLDLSGSVTRVDAVIVSNDGYVAAAGAGSSVGKHTPYVPDWQATAQASYRASPSWVVSLAGRYSGKQYATVDNSDVNGHTYQGFERYAVADVRAHYQINRQWELALGFDNLNNRSYYLFHPFPQRTLVSELKFTY